MPIYEEDMPAAEMELAVNAGKKCGECGGLLVTAWGGSMDYHGYILRCGNDINHNTILSVGRKTKAEVEGQNIFRGYSMKALTEYTPTEMVVRATSAGLFPQTMTIQQKQAIGVICVEYGLDPLMGELQIYQGRPFVTMAARLRKAHEALMPLAGISTRPASETEKLARGYLATDFVMIAEAYKQNGEQRLGPFVGWGIVKQTEIDRNVANAKAHNRSADSLPVVNDPTQHAEKRAISRSLRMGWHIPLPTFEDIGEANVAAGRSYDVDSTAVEVEAPGKTAEAEAADIKARVGKETAAAKKELEKKATAEAAAKATAEVAAKAAAKAAGEAPTEAEGQRVDLFAWILQNKPDLKNEKTIREWITKVVGVEAGLIDTAPQACYKPIAELTGWSL